MNKTLRLVILSLLAAGLAMLAMPSLQANPGGQCGLGAVAAGTPPTNVAQCWWPYEGESCGDHNYDLYCDCSCSDAADYWCDGPSIGGQCNGCDTCNTPLEEE